MSTNEGAKERRLIAVGIPQEQARAITAALEQAVHMRANLRARAAREGWLDTEKYALTLMRLPDGRQVIRSRFGDYVYDQYLYANLEPNRLVVQSVYSDSPAERIGLKKGDMILSLNGERVYSTQDLIAITSVRTEDKELPIVICRGGSEFVDYVSPGPLGIISMPGFVRPNSY